jgi:hypothetical protein
VRGAGDVISYLEMCQEEGLNLQQGMNFRIRGGSTVILMSVRAGAPYSDEVQDNGRVLVYEGHDVPRTRGGVDPKTVDQELTTPSGSLTQNGRFFGAARRHREEGEPSELVRVYEKLRSGIWVYNGTFRLVDAWGEQVDDRRVFKFRLETAPDETPVTDDRERPLDHNRLIPTPVKLEVWRRDSGRCVTCGSSDNLHFDHVIPYSRGGSLPHRRQHSAALCAAQSRQARPDRMRRAFQRFTDLPAGAA